MGISRDFEEFFALLNKHSVRYLIVGGYAFAIHAKLRCTNDIDIWIDAEETNARRAMSTLSEFGLGGSGVEITDLTTPEKVIQLGSGRIGVMPHQGAFCC